jgi:DNA-binding winged helix-turn-helix (wHTH) protein
VHGLRRRLADAGARGNLIRNIYGEGYIFTTEVEALAQTEPLPQEFERSEAIAV